MKARGQGGPDARPVADAARSDLDDLPDFGRARLVAVLA
jgi:hypothetical protein